MLALTLALLLQDPSVEEHVKALSNEDIAVREKATAELLKTPLDKLDLLAKHLKSADAETGVRLRLIVTKVLGNTLGTRTAKFELRPLADVRVQDDWVAAGADPKAPPKGFEARRFHAKAMDETEDRPREWVLVGVACVTHQDIKAAREEFDVENGLWSVRFELAKEGAKRFDEAAASLYKKEPKGRLAIILDGMILSAPTVNAESFGGIGFILGRFSQPDAKRLVKALLGESMEPFMRAVKEKESAVAPDKLAELIRGMKGADLLAVKVDGSELDISGFIDSQELVSIWQSLREQGYRLVPKK